MLGSGIVAVVFGATGFLGRYVVQQLGEWNINFVIMELAHWPMFFLYCICDFVSAYFYHKHGESSLIPSLVVESFCFYFSLIHVCLYYNFFPAKMGSQVLVPFRGSEDSHRHLKLMGDLGQVE